MFRKRRIAEHKTLRALQERPESFIPASIIRLFFLNKQQHFQLKPVRYIDQIYDRL